MFRILAGLYLVYFLGWCALDWFDLRRSGYPKWLLALDLASHAYLVAGMGMYLTGYAPGWIHEYWWFGLLVVVGLEVASRTIAFRHEEHDLDLSVSVNNTMHASVLAYVLLTLIPAFFMNFRLSQPDSSLMSIAFLLIPAALGGLAGSFFPRLPSVYKSSNERDMVEWLTASEEFPSAPICVEWIDSREQQWPGFEEPVHCHLFKISYEDRSYVGIQGPIVFCFPEAVTEPVDPDQVYTQYKDWFVKELSKEILKHAAQGFPEKFRKLVDEALDSGSSNTEN